MHNLNELSHLGGDILIDYAKRVKEDFPPTFYGVEMGVAWGGGVEAIGKLWRGCGIVYGYDTFEGHPTHLCGSTKDEYWEIHAMDGAYDSLGIEGLSYEYQRSQLDKQGLDNVILVKGLVTKDSCSNIPYINYCLLDLDILESMKIGYDAVSDKIVPNGYLCIHDYGACMPRLTRWVDDVILGSGIWNTHKYFPNAILIVLQKKAGLPNTSP